MELPVSVYMLAIPPPPHVCHGPQQSSGLEVTEQQYSEAFLSLPEQGPLGLGSPSTRALADQDPVALGLLCEQ